jgi:hypothetical protein
MGEIFLFGEGASAALVPLLDVDAYPGLLLPIELEDGEIFLLIDELLVESYPLEYLDNVDVGVSGVDVSDWRRYLLTMLEPWFKEDDLETDSFDLVAEVFDADEYGR